MEGLRSVAAQRIKGKSNVTRQYHGVSLRPDGVERGDVMSPATRSALMSRIKGKGTKPELIIAKLIREIGPRAQQHCRDLPGSPDFVFRRHMVAVFVDGDFWHGWRFPAWSAKLTPAWAAKIAANRKRDRRNHQRLRRMGWRVIRIWEHQAKRSPGACKARISKALAKKSHRSPGAPSRTA